MREQSKRLFYISRKLASDDFKQVVSGLQQSRIFVSEVRTIDLLNTIVMCILDLFNTAKFSYIKSECATILHSCKHFVSVLPSKPQIISTLSKCLKSSDPLIRILTLQIVIQLKQLFSKDTSVYHLMCSRLKWRQQMSKKQQLRTIQCLEVLLATSEYLAQMFSNNISELHELGGIEVKIIVYLCGKAKFESEGYWRIMKEVLNICKICDNKQNKIIKYYMSKLIVKASKNNYLCLQLYKKQLFHLLPNIGQYINKIEQWQYNFMHNPTNNSAEHLQQENKKQEMGKLDNGALFDICYEHIEVESELAGHLQNQVKNRIILNNENGKQNKINQCLLMLSMLINKASRQEYEIENVFIQQYKQHTNNNNNNNNNNSYSSNIKLLKISLASCNYKLANIIINVCNNSDIYINQYTNALLLFHIYTQMHINQHKQNNINNNNNNIYINVFITLLCNIAMSCRQPYLLALAKLWRLKYIALSNTNIQQYNLLPQHEPQTLSLLANAMQQQNNNNSKQYEPIQSKYIKCEQELQNCRNQTVPVLPVCLRQCKYGGIYFTKKTIIDIFKYL